MSNILHFKPERENVLKHVADNVRRLRLAIGLSQAQLAELTGLSRRMIIHIESGESNISLSSLDKVADGLGVSFYQLVSAPGRSPERLEMVAWKGEKETSFAMILGNVPAKKNTSLWLWVLEPGERYTANPDPKGWHEMIYVFEGCLMLGLENGTEVIEAGDFKIFSSAQHYWYEGNASVTTKFVRNVVS